MDFSLVAGGIIAIMGVLVGAGIVRRNSMAIKFYNQEQLAALLGVAPKTLEKWRWKGAGPRFVKLGRRVVYNEEDVIEFVVAQTKVSTRGAGKLSTTKKKRGK